MTQKRYKVNEIFHSLQGEGEYAGYSAIFVRFAGCNLDCPFCDTDHGTANFSYTLTELLQAVTATHDNTDIVVLTGGEPALQADKKLINALQEEGFMVHIETNGTLPLPDGPDWIVCSPKQLPLAIKHADEIKMLFDGTNTEFVYDCMCLNLGQERLSLQPIDTGDKLKNAVILKKAIEFVMDAPMVRLSVQLHKMLSIP